MGPPDAERRSLSDNQSGQNTIFNPFMPTVPTLAVRETDSKCWNGGQKLVANVEHLERHTADVEHGNLFLIFVTGLISDFFDRSYVNCVIKLLKFRVRHV